MERINQGDEVLIAQIDDKLESIAERAKAHDEQMLTEMETSFAFSPRRSLPSARKLMHFIQWCDASARERQEICLSTRTSGVVRQGQEATEWGDFAVIQQEEREAYEESEKIHEEVNAPRQVSEEARGRPKAKQLRLPDATRLRLLVKIEQSNGSK
eukprot:755558-Hanusia_phi.AAC.3